MSRQLLASASLTAPARAAVRPGRGLGLALGLGMLGLCALCGASFARSSERGGKADRAAPKEDRATRRALELVKKGDEARGRSLWAQALQQYQLAYEAKPLPAIQRQIGDCHRGMGNAGRASFAYHQYLKYAGEVPDRREVEELAQRMDELAAQTRGGLQADSAPDDAEPPPAALSPERPSEPAAAKR